MNNPEWYSAKTIYQSRLVEESIFKTIYEERIVLFRAMDFEDASAQAETEATEYGRVHSGTEYLGFMDIYHIGDDALDRETEVFSLLRDSELSNQDYLARFCDDGKEHRKKV